MLAASDFREEAFLPLWQVTALGLPTSAAAWFCNAPILQTGNCSPWNKLPLGALTATLSFVPVLADALVVQTNHIADRKSVV